MATLTNLIAVVSIVVLAGVFIGWAGAGIGRAIDQYTICKQERSNAQTRNRV